MGLLRDLGLSEGIPAEIVLTTYCPDGKPHASTMGVRIGVESKVLLRVFAGTRTFHNLLKSRAAVINVVRDPELLTKLALKNLFNFDPGTLKFGRSGHVNAPKLEEAEAFVEIEVGPPRLDRVSDELGTSEVGHFEGEVKNIHAGRAGVRALRRTESPVVDSAVLATKIATAVEKGKRGLAEGMFEKLKKRRGAAPPGSKEHHLITELVELLGRRYGWGR
jgi:hypothetical protein